MTKLAIDDGPLAALLPEIHDGRGIELTEGDKVVAVVVPVGKQKLIHSEKVRTLPVPKAGSLKGQIWMAPDFDSPLEEFKEYME